MPIPRLVSRRSTRGLGSRAWGSTPIPACSSDVASGARTLFTGPARPGGCSPVGCTIRWITALGGATPWSCKRTATTRRRSLPRAWSPRGTPPRRAGVADTPDEGPFDQDMLEGAIDALDQRGLIDRTKVGLQGFSRTCYTGLYFLTHSSYSIAAADLSDGVDYSYVQYIVYGGGTSAERINGGSPWGSSHVQWLERAPGFRLDRVTTPLRLTAIGPHSVLQEWEPYAGLLAQGKPAELVYIPDGSHILVKPWERMTSQQGVVDWWRFWLQGYEDPDPAKAEQYGRWRKLAAQRDSSTLSTPR